MEPSLELQENQDKKIEEKRTIYTGVSVPVKLLDRVILGGFATLVIFFVLMFLL